ncbi:PilZ domain-containing protein [Desulfocicer vacuolatum DSM 3385]|uniref:PilZ domain-containing protein n=1 Tax=Desulfocicer vacuolatum DSM 3385 TaxID=1121400 RepID=A0A1W2E9C3_9BACT|nr:PilZ domain-containing protein [Desulfocicer vacuolatum]SMD06354.1 PilZ domain-containing protein [Desulfocicer vacuolatum DSM 3385]
MQEPSILFQSISGEKEAESPVRKAFRVPVPDNASVHLSLGKKEYSLVNISHGGISVLCDESLDVECDERLPGWNVHIGKIQLNNLTGRVIHCSSMPSGQLLYGIQWVDVTEEQTVNIHEAVARLKAMAFEDNERHIDLAQDDEK